MLELTACGKAHLCVPINVQCYDAQDQRWSYQPDDFFTYGIVCGRVMLQLIRRHSGVGCTCNPGLCPVHSIGIPLSAERKAAFLTEAASSIQDDGKSYFDQASNHSFGPYASSIFLRSYPVYYQ